MAIKIVTDSAADILPAEAEQLGIEVIPLTLNWDGSEYKDGIDFKIDEFFGLLINSESIPTTSQIPPETFAGVFSKLTAGGDEVIAICLSSVLSGTCQSANIAAADFNGKVHVVDSLSATMGQRLLILRALQCISAGMSAAETVSTLEEERGRIRVLAKLDTLKFLKKGGRISATVAFAGEMLNIKPVITVTDGAVVLAGKARGSKNASNLLRGMIKDCGGIDFSAPVCLAYSGTERSGLDQYIEDSGDLYEGKLSELPVAPIGAVIGTHVGPGAVGLAFFENKK